MTAAALTGLTLPFHFDPVRLQNDLALVGPDEWSPHYNERDFGGEWQGIALRSAAGSERDLHAGHAGSPVFRDTPLLARCGYFGEILSLFQCPLKSVRLLSLAPGSFIREHSDPALGFEDGEIRVHIPVRTNPDVEFYVCGERLLLAAGGCYYVNVNLPHRVNNRGTANRVHLVIDAEVNDWVRGLFTQCIANRDAIPRSSLPPRGFSEFSELVFADAGLRDRLRAIPDRGALLRAAEREATARGFDLNEADIEAAFRSAPPPCDTPGKASFYAEGWLPIHIEFRDSQPWATWICAPDHRFTEPFFSDSVQVCLRNPFTDLFRREMPLRNLPDIRPDGFIFHMSRCGSTLISRSLAAAESLFVVSEPPPVDEIIQGSRTSSPEQRSNWLRGIVSALAQVRRPGQTHYLIKLDSWHIRSLPLFRAAFPDVPWLFVYRDPLEVMASQLRRPGLHTSPGAMDPAILGMRFEDIISLTRPLWCARVLGDFMAAALCFRDDPNGMFVDYRELPGAIRGKIARHFGLELSAKDAARVEAATRQDSKNPLVDFSTDPEESRRRMESFPPDADTDALRALYRELSVVSSDGVPAA